MSGIAGLVLTETDCAKKKEKAHPLDAPW